MKQCETLSLQRQWPVNKLGCRAQLQLPLILHPPPRLLSLSVGMYPHLKGNCVTHSTHAIFRRKKSCGFVPPSDFRLFTSSLSHPPRGLCSVGWLVADTLYSLVNTTDPQKPPRKIPQGSVPLKLLSCCERSGLLDKSVVPPVFKAKAAVYNLSTLDGIFIPTCSQLQVYINPDISIQSDSQSFATDVMEVF